MMALTGITNESVSGPLELLKEIIHTYDKAFPEHTLSPVIAIGAEVSVSSVFVTAVTNPPPFFSTTTMQLFLALLVAHTKYISSYSHAKSPSISVTLFHQ